MNLNAIAIVIYIILSQFAKDPKKYEELCDVLHERSFPPARLPWIPVVESQRRFVKTLHYQIQESSAQEKCRSLQLQRMIAATIPYYLPKRYDKY